MQIAGDELLSFCQQIRFRADHGIDFKITQIARKFFQASLFWHQINHGHALFAPTISFCFQQWHLAKELLDIARHDIRQAGQAQIPHAFLKQAQVSLCMAVVMIKILNRGVWLVSQ